MVNYRAKMKVWPLMIVCQLAGAVHTGLCQNYGAEVFLLQWDQFTALRGCPAKVVSDRGSQLTAAAHYISWPASQDPSGRYWDMVSSR